MKQSMKCKYLCAVMLLVLPTSIVPVAGVLDTTFNGDGFVRTEIGDGTLDTLNSIAIQTDSKIVAGGFAVVGGVRQFVLVRYNTDGSLDTSFGGTGIVITQAGTTLSEIASIALQTDGKIVVGGRERTLGVTQFAVARYNTDGSLDTSFGGTGIVTTSIPTNPIIRSIAIQSDGKIVVGGSATVAGVQQFVVARYNTDGSLDTSFDGDGKVFTIIGTASFIRSITLQADGKIIAAGPATILGVQQFAVVRYNTDGSLDTTFGTGGITTTLIPTTTLSFPFSVALQADNKIVLAGTGEVGGANLFGLARYTTNGILDTSFGDAGTVLTSINGIDDEILAMAIECDGKIVVGGYTTPDGINSFFALARYNNDGSLDTTFGINATGIVVTPIGINDGIFSVKFQNNGKIVVGGSSQISGLSEFTVARYLNDVRCVNGAISCISQAILNKYCLITAVSN